MVWCVAGGLHRWRKHTPCSPHVASSRVSADAKHTHRHHATPRRQPVPAAPTRPPAGPVRLSPCPAWPRPAPAPCGALPCPDGIPCLDEAKETQARRRPIAHVCAFLCRPSKHHPPAATQRPPAPRSAFGQRAEARHPRAGEAAPALEGEAITTCDPKNGWDRKSAKRAGFAGSGQQDTRDCYPREGCTASEHLYGDIEETERWLVVLCTGDMFWFMHL